LTTGADGEAFAVRYGVARKQIQQLPHPVDVEHYASALSMDPAVRSSVRTRLGIQGLTFTYVGRLWRPKGITTLIHAFTKIRAQLVDASLLLVGDGDQEIELRELANSLGSEGIVFAGYVQKAELPTIF